jgi:glycosyltransferase involved in cell wall biosynthesis
MNVPVITTNVGGNELLIQNGFIFQAKDITALTSLLEAVYREFKIESNTR